MAQLPLMSARPAQAVTGPPGDQRGVVMVEFVLAFMPIFLLFLGTVQLALAGAAHLVVQHAATVAVRSAAVIVEDDPGNYGEAPRNDLSSGSPEVSRVRALLGLSQPSGSALPGVGAVVVRGASLLFGQDSGAQRGARMAAIREAAYVPLLALAPSPSSLRRDTEGSVAAALRSSGLYQVTSALDYSRAAAVITLHATVAANDSPPRGLVRDQLITARVTYFFHCGVPLLSALICKTLEVMRESAPGTPASAESPSRRLEHAERRGALAETTGPFDRFMVLEGTASFPGQGAAYADEGEE